MPRVGSSRISRLGWRQSQRARITFCWLPPDRLRTGVVGLGVLMSRRRIISSTTRALAPRVEHAQPREQGQRGQQDVVAHAERRDDALGLAVLGDEPMPGAHGVARRADAAAAAVHGDRAGLGAVGAEDRARQLGAARAEQPGQAHDLALAHAQAHVVGRVAARQVLDLEHRLAPARRAGLAEGGQARGAHLLGVAAEHQRDQAQRIGLARWRRW